MPLPKILRQFDRLDKSSPQFPDELTNLFDGGGYKGWIFWLQDEGASWFIEYLDKVCIRIVLYSLSTQPA